MESESSLEGCLLWAEYTVESKPESISTYTIGTTLRRYCWIAPCMGIQDGFGFYVVLLYNEGIFFFGGGGGGRGVFILKKS